MKTISNKFKALKWGSLLFCLITCALLVGACSSAQRWAQESPATIEARNHNLAQSLPMPDEISYSYQYFTWRDKDRNREVPAKLYLPSQPAQPNVALADTLPLIVFSHGLGGSREGYTYLGKYWASQGFATLHVQHVQSDRKIWGGNLFALTSRLQQATSEHEAANRALDITFALDALLQDPKWANRIDTKRIAIAGHSYGANTAMLLAGAKLERGGKQINFADPRFSAAILISAPPFYNDPALETVIGHIAIPTLHLTATADIINVPGHYSGYQDRLQVFKAIGSKTVHTPTKALVVFNSGSHSMFTDRLNTASQHTNLQAKQITRKTALQFLQSVWLDQKPQDWRLWLPPTNEYVAVVQLEPDTAGAQQDFAISPLAQTH